MAKDLNKVQFTGRLGADPEMRILQSGAATTSFRVASNRSYKNRDGQTIDETEWFRVVTWNKLAEVCGQYLAKGTRVYIEGRLQTRRYTDRDGQERTTVEIVADDMIILSGRGEQASRDMGDPEDERTLLDDGAPAQRVPAARQGRAPQQDQGHPRGRPGPMPESDDIF